MTREETKKRIKVMQAFVDGKDVEVLNTDKLELVSNPSCSPATKYRIKPGPSYRPFESAQECIEEMRRHEPFGWVKYKPGFGDKCSSITEVSISSIRIGVTWFCTKEMFQYITFLDGSQFGIKVEDKEDSHE